MRTVRGAGHPVHPGAGAAVSVTFVPLVEMLHLHVAAEAHKYACAVWGGTQNRRVGKFLTHTKKRARYSDKGTEGKAVGVRRCCPV